MLVDQVVEHRLQPDLFGDINLHSVQVTHARSHALDIINNRYGAGTLHYAAEDLSQAWQPRQQLRSPRYTTDWSELPLLGQPR